MDVYGLLRPLLFALDAETTHGLTLSALSVRQRMWPRAGSLGTLPTRALGIDFPNPIGLAAGLDKDGRCIDALAGLGFGFVEVGTVTPRPQAGNPRPRLFRLADHEAVINRMGFNNDGCDALVGRLARLAGRHPGSVRPWVLGINIGRNKDTPAEHAAADYSYCLEQVYAYADYVTVNVSSPNTPGLRDLQAIDALDQLLTALAVTRQRAEDAHGRRVPIVVKLSPDLDHETLPRIVAVLVARGVEGVIATNTTIDRPQVAGHSLAANAGGLSGRPLAPLADALLARLKAVAGNALVLIASGGVADADAVTRKLALGATLVQLYTGLVYRGPALIAESVAAARRARDVALR